MYKALIRTSPRNFSSNSTDICANSEIHPIHQSQQWASAGGAKRAFAPSWKLGL